MKKQKKERTNLSSWLVRTEDKENFVMCGPVKDALFCVENGLRTSAEVAKALGCSQSSACNYLKGLVEAKLLERELMESESPAKNAGYYQYFLIKNFDSYPLSRIGEAERKNNMPMSYSHLHLYNGKDYALVTYLTNKIIGKLRTGKVMTTAQLSSDHSERNSMLRILHRMYKLGMCTRTQATSGEWSYRIIGNFINIKNATMVFACSSGRKKQTMKMV